MTRTNALDLIARLGRAEASLHGQEFLAPLLPNGQARLRLCGLIYVLKVPAAYPGWWRCQVHTARQAAIIAEALPWQRGDYLALWPVLRLVLLEPLPDKAWLALPYNPSAAAQRFSLSGGPLVVHLVERGQPFERVIGRVEGRTIWYDDHDHRADPCIAEALRAALAAGQTTPGVQGLGAGEQSAYLLRVNQMAAQQAHTAEQDTEQQLRHALDVGGAHLLGYALTDHGLQVTWDRNGQRSVALVATDLSVVSAGVCLSGEEASFDLTSIVGVVQDAPAFARWDETE